MPIMPRAKFFQTLVLAISGICLGAAIAMLGLWSSIKARQHTTAPGSTSTYNSSQSVVCAMWLFANIWFANMLRAKRPALNLPVIMYSIFSNIAFTYGPLFPTLSRAENLVKTMLQAFMTAFALATGVNLFVIPVSCRTVVFKEQAGYIQALRGLLKAQTAYLQSLEESDMFAGPPPSDSDTEGTSSVSDEASPGPAQSPQAKALMGAVAGLRGLHGKLYGDMAFAKREVAWGKLCAKDIDTIFGLFRGVMIPLIGMSTINDIFERIGERRGWIKPTGPKYRSENWEHLPLEKKLEEKRLWNEVMKTLREPFAVAAATIDQGLEHTAIVLELVPRPKKKSDDIEATANQLKPGDEGFAAHMQKVLDDFYSKRGITLRKWAKEKGLSEEQFDAAGPLPPAGNAYTADEAAHRRDQQQLYLILFMENLVSFKCFSGCYVTKIS
jgi:hypothetical protein